MNYQNNKSYPKVGKVEKKRKGIRKIGTIGKANIEANKRLKTLFSGVTACEMKLDGCLVNWLLQFAHRHKRAFYKGDVEKMSDYKQVVIACQVCHQATEFNRPLNDEIFMRLRGNE